MASGSESLRRTLEAFGVFSRDTNQRGKNSFEVQPIMPESSGVDAGNGTMRWGM